MWCTSFVDGLLEGFLSGEGLLGIDGDGDGDYEDCV